MLSSTKSWRDSRGAGTWGRPSYSAKHQRAWSAPTAIGASCWWGSHGGKTGGKARAAEALSQPYFRAHRMSDVALAAIDNVEARK